jgi:hypothetical protein
MSILPSNQKPIFHRGAYIQNQDSIIGIEADHDKANYEANIHNAQSGATFATINQNKDRVTTTFSVGSFVRNIDSASTCLDSTTGTPHPDNPCIVCLNGLWKHRSEIDPCFVYFAAQRACQSYPIHNQCYSCEASFTSTNPQTGMTENLTSPVPKFTLLCEACQKCGNDGTCINNCPNGYECTPKYSDIDGKITYECAAKCREHTDCDRSNCEICDGGVCKEACYSGQQCIDGQCVDRCDPPCSDNDCKFCQLNPETQSVACVSFCRPDQICCKGECYDNNCRCNATFDTNTCSCGPENCPEGFSCLGESNDPNSVCVELDVEGCTYYDANGVRQQGCDPSIPCNDCYTIYSSEYNPPLMFSICRTCPAETSCYEGSCVPTDDLNCQLPCHALIFDDSKCVRTQINGSNSECYTCQDICAKLGPRLTCYNGICQEVYDIRPLLANILP